MPDVFTRAQRSAVMARIRSRGNRDTELALAGLLRAHKIIGWRRHRLVRVAVEGSSLRVEGRKPRRRSQRSTFSSQLTVRPDFVFPKQRVALFVDGCFWHACPRHATQPKSNRAFWRKKLAGNKARDQLVNRTLRRAGWRVLRIWEHALKQSQVRSGKGEPSKLVRRIERLLAGGLSEPG